MLVTVVLAVALAVALGVALGVALAADLSGGCSTEAADGMACGLLDAIGMELDLDMVSSLSLLLLVVLPSRIDLTSV